MQEYINNKKRSHTQLDSRKQVIAFQDRVMTINIKEETLNKLCDEPGVHEQDPDNDNELFIAVIDGEGPDDVAQSQWQLPLLTSGTYVTYTLDTGAMCNMLPQNVYNLLEKRPKLHKTKGEALQLQRRVYPCCGERYC